MLDEAAERIIDRSQNPHFSGTVHDHSHCSSGENQSCGDEVTFEACIENGVITQLKHSSRACSVCTASADLLAEHLQGKKATEIETLNAEDISSWIGIPLSPTRLKCALLPLEVLKKLLK